MYSVFLARTLQPVTQLPQSLQGSCCTSGRCSRSMREVDHDIQRLGRHADFLRSPVERLHLRQLSARGCGFAPASDAPAVEGRQGVVRDRRRPVELLEHLAVRPIATLALISDVPPSPDPLITEMSGIIQQFVQSQRIAGSCASRPPRPAVVSGNVPGLPLLAALQNADRGLGIQIGVASRAAVIAPP